MSLKLERQDGVEGGVPRSGNGVSISFRAYFIICFQMPAPLSGMSRAWNLKIPTKRGLRYKALRASIGRWEGPRPLPPDGSMSLS